LGVDDVLAYIDQFGADGVPALVLVDELLVFQRDSDFMKGYFDLSWNLQQDRRAATATFVREMYKKPQTEEYLQRITTEAMHTPTNTAIALLDAWVARAPLLTKVEQAHAHCGVFVRRRASFKEPQGNASGAWPAYLRQKAEARVKECVWHG